MRSFFKGVRKHIGSLDAKQLREQYALVSDEFARTEMLLHALKEGIVVLDADGHPVRENRAARDLFGMEPRDFLPSLALPLGKSSKREVNLTYPDARTVEIQTIPLGDETIVLLRDVTAERRRTEEELHAGATKAVRELAAGVAHEIGNPLNAISLNLQLLERAHPDDDLVGECRRQVSRLDGIIRGFLQALRPSRPRLAAGSLADPLHRCLTTLRQQFEERRISVTLDVPAALPPGALDTDQMEQVFFNLVKNALEAMKDGDALKIDLFSTDEDVAVRIADNGIGMDAGQLANLFEAYHTSKADGNGLGLMVSARIVRDHGGAIEADSAPGEGSVFTVRLPRLEKRIRRLGN
jgi:signal transduction histidine kinase